MLKIMICSMSGAIYEKNEKMKYFFANFYLASVLSPQRRDIFAIFAN